jgi:hypothetical protein
MRSGATKEPYFYSSLGRAENEGSCLPRGRDAVHFAGVSNI